MPARSIHLTPYFLSFPSPSCTGFTNSVTYIGQPNPENGCMNNSPNRRLRGAGPGGCVPSRREAEGILTVVPTSSNSPNEVIVPRMLPSGDERRGRNRHFCLGPRTRKAMLMERASWRKWRGKGLCTTWSKPAGWTRRTSGCSQSVNEMPAWAGSGMLPRAATGEDMTRPRTHRAEPATARERQSPSSLECRVARLRMALEAIPSRNPKTRC